MGVREGRFVFIEMEPASRSKAEQGTSEFEFITNTLGHFPFILTVMSFWASASLGGQSHWRADPPLRTLHFSHFAGFDWANAFRKKGLLIRVKSLAASGLLLVRFVRCCWPAGSAGSACSHTFSKFCWLLCPPCLQLSHFIHSPSHLPRALLLGLEHVARSPQLVCRASSSTTF